MADKTVKVTVKFEVNIDVLKQKYAENNNINIKDVAFNEALTSELQWLIDSGIYVIDWEVNKNDNK